MADIKKIPFTDLTSSQLDSLLNKFQLTAMDYDEDGKLELLRCSKVFCRGVNDYTDSDLVAVFNKKGICVDIESSDGKLKGIFAKSKGDVSLFGMLQRSDR